MKFSEGMAVIEAVLFACGEPIDAAKLSEACEIEKDTVLKIIDRLNDRYTENGSAFRINRLGDSYQMMTQPQFAPYIKTRAETQPARYRCPRRRWRFWLWWRTTSRSPRVLWSRCAESTAPAL